MSNFISSFIIQIIRISKHQILVLPFYQAVQFIKIFLVFHPTAYVCMYTMYHGKNCHTSKQILFKLFFLLAVRVLHPHVCILCTTFFLHEYSTRTCIRRVHTSVVPWLQYRCKISTCMYTMYYGKNCHTSKQILFKFFFSTCS